MERRKPEILAPAGAWEQLAAAVACGADAVYLGGSALNARRNAGNFDDEELERAVRYCHARGVKAYLTMNTVVLEREVPQALGLVQTACRLGMDALIVQDLGLVNLIRRAAPGMRLHASTQMAVHNLSGALQLEDLGFTRVVLAREMSREEIARVAQGTHLEVEVFVHGALCMCVSGQCYMSSVIGERSGNRGLCAQPCRLPFFRREKGRCDLSLKDLSLVERLEDLREIGAASLKIEGRMKRPEYVAAAVTACREALEGGKPDLEQLQAVFSRSGFTDGYYQGRLGNHMFGTRQKEDVVSAAPVLKDLARLYQKEAQRVPLRASFRLEAGAPALLEWEDPEGNHVRVEGDCPEPARAKPTTPELVRQSLDKLGGTPYFLAHADVRCGPDLALPVSRINGMRREATQRLTALREEPRPIPFQPLDHDPLAAPKPPNPKPPALRARFRHAAQLPEESALAGLELVILPPKEALLALDRVPPDRLAAELPRIDFADYKDVERELAELRERGVTRLLAGNLGGVRWGREHGFAVHGDFALNLTNRYALEQCARLGCADATLSYELNLLDAKRLGDFLPCGILAYGHLPLMITRNCPVKLEGDCGSCPGLTRMYDRLGNAFWVGCGGDRQMIQVYNHLPLYMADRLRETQGFSFLTLWFSVEDAGECGRVIGEYRQGGRREKITRGLYYRNIL